jgi:hypothetical protein
MNVNCKSVDYKELKEFLEGFVFKEEIVRHPLILKEFKV